MPRWGKEKSRLSRRTRSRSAGVLRYVEESATKFNAERRDFSKPHKKRGTRTEVQIPLIVPRAIQRVDRSQSLLGTSVDSIFLSRGLTLRVGTLEPWRTLLIQRPPHGAERRPETPHRPAPHFDPTMLTPVWSRPAVKWDARRGRRIRRARQTMCCHRMFSPDPQGPEKNSCCHSRQRKSARRTERTTSVLVQPESLNRVKERCASEEEESNVCRSKPAPFFLSALVRNDNIPASRNPHSSLSLHAFSTRLSTSLMEYFS